MLEDDIKSMKKVRLLRTTKREGLIRARLTGAYEAKGQVLIFLDSHCECAEGWLEPLLDPIARNPKASVVPLIEIVDDSTFEFKVTPIEGIQVGGFDWNLIFNWHMTPEREMKRRKNRTDPVRYSSCLDLVRGIHDSRLNAEVQRWLVGCLRLIVHGSKNWACTIQAWIFGVGKILNYLSK